MNEPFESDGIPAELIPEVPEPRLETESAPRRPFAYWLKRFFACNPFYLVSAAMLLFGLYRVSMEPGFLTRESAQLAFNFTSLQVYEMLLVGTAIFLAHRRIWYDSTLLVGLENLLLLLPFMLISQAALIDQATVGRISLLAGILVVIRFASLKTFLTELNLPRRLLLIGALVLAVNVTLLAVFRMLQEDRSQKWGPAYEMNEYSWLLILPAVFALGNFLPRVKEVGKLPMQHRWLPVGLFALWLGGTCVHLYCLRYVYEFDLRRELIVPSLWVLAWTILWRISDFIALPKPNLKRALMIVPMATTCVAVENQNRVFLILCVLNAAVFAIHGVLQRHEKLARHLAFASVVMFLAGLPADNVARVVPQIHRGNVLLAVVAFYLVLGTLISRNPRMGLLGALISGTITAVLLHRQPLAVHWSLQVALSFLLLHSLRWDDAVNPRADQVRVGVSLLWIAHALVWMRWGGDWWMACVPATAILAGCLWARWLQGRWAYLVLPASAVMVALAGPANTLFAVLQKAPGGLLGVAGSFLLFAIGTAAALTKDRWQHRAAS